MAMKNITISLDDDTAELARLAAAEQGKSVSRYISDTLRKQMPKALAYEAAMTRFFAREEELGPLRKPGEQLPTREDLYDRPVLRRR
jgi:hypothetical protein